MRILKFTIPCLLILGACKNSDSWMGRQWHNTTAHYNMYFNAEQKWMEVVSGLREGYKDDYRTFIELYNYGTAEGLKANQGSMDEVVKQVSTMIDRHPRSKWVDDAYLLMGKAYFMKGDFIAASDLFQFVNTNYKDPEIIYRSRLWVFQTLYQQKKWTEAEDLVKALKEDKDFPKSLQGELNKAIGAVMVKEGKLATSAEFLELALTKARGKMERYRLHFLLAQVYQQLKKYDEAGSHYARVIKMNPPYDMAFNARVSLTEMLAIKGGSYNKVNSILKRMLRDDKNIDYYGQIYYRLGLNELKAGNDAKALSYFNTSLRKSSGDNAQMTTTYLALGDYYYQKRVYEPAGLYYDSANRKLDEKHPEYEKIAKKSTQLSELLRHLLTVKREDSLLRLAADPVLREKTIDKLVEAERKRILEGKTDPAPAPPPADPSGGPVAGTSSSFPFYNPALKSKSAQEFQSYWGNRVNRDYWRINAKKSALPGAGGDSVIAPEDTGSSPGIPEGIAADRKKYYKDLPLSADAKKAALEKIEESLFMAAGIYQNQLLENGDAIRLYQELLTRFPKTKYEAQTLYELAKMYKADGKTADYEKYLGMLKNKFPGSLYLKLLEGNSNQVQNGTEVSELREVEDLYNTMYKQFREAAYKEAMETKLLADRKYTGNALQSRFDYLYALCVFKMGQTDKGMELLQQVVADYPATDIAAQATANIEAWNRLKSATPATDTIAGPAEAGELWKTWDGKEELFFMLVFPKGANTNLLRAALNDFNKENFIFEPLEVSTARSSGETVYISVSNFTTPAKTKEYVDFLLAKPEFFASKGLFEFELAWISKTNYTTLATNNRINAYMEFYRGKVK